MIPLCEIPPWSEARNPLIKPDAPLEQELVPDDEQPETFPSTQKNWDNAREKHTKVRTPPTVLEILLDVF